MKIRQLADRFYLESKDGSMSLEVLGSFEKLSAEQRRETVRTFLLAYGLAEETNADEPTKS